MSGGFTPTLKTLHSFLTNKFYFQKKLSIFHESLIFSTLSLAVPFTFPADESYCWNSIQENIIQVRFPGQVEYKD